MLVSHTQRVLSASWAVTPPPHIRYSYSLRAGCSIDWSCLACSAATREVPKMKKPTDPPKIAIQELVKSGNKKLDLDDPCALRSVDSVACLIVVRTYICYAQKESDVALDLQVV